MNGKEKCKLLKKIREMIAKKNGVPYETEECTAKGDCKGYCPKCDEELRDLNKAIAEQEAKGKKKKIPKITEDVAFKGETNAEKLRLKNMYEQEMENIYEQMRLAEERRSYLKREFETLSNSQNENDPQAQFRIKCLEEKMNQIRERIKSLQERRVLLEKKIASDFQTTGIMPADTEELSKALQNVKTQQLMGDIIRPKDCLMDDSLVTDFDKSELFKIREQKNAELEELEDLLFGGNPYEKNTDTTKKMNLFKVPKKQPACDDKDDLVQKNDEGKLEELQKLRKELEQSLQEDYDKVEEMSLLAKNGDKASEMQLELLYSRIKKQRMQLKLLEEEIVMQIQKNSFNEPLMGDMVMPEKWSGLDPSSQLDEESEEDK